MSYTYLLDDVILPFIVSDFYHMIIPFFSDSRSIASRVVSDYESQRL